MTDPRTPAPGEIQIVVLLGYATYIAWAPGASVEQLMDAFEARSGLTPEDRASRLSHASIRVRIARDLRSADAAQLFTEVLASGCVWLALRHWSGGADIRRGLDETMRTEGAAVVTCSIADPAPEGMMADSAWAFMVGTRIHDGRAQLAAVEPGEIEIMRG
jgi:hypothetical protein